MLMCLTPCDGDFSPQSAHVACPRARTRVNTDTRHACLPCFSGDGLLSTPVIVFSALLALHPQFQPSASLLACPGGARSADGGPNYMRPRVLALSSAPWPRSRRGRFTSTKVCLG